MREVLNLIQHHGDLFYLITFVWTALEGETFVIFAGLAAQRGFLNIYALFTAAWLGSFFGDQVLFLMGRYYGVRVLNRFPKLKPKTDKVLKSLEKYHVVFILTYRFIYGVRNVSSLAVGLSRLSWRRFASLNLVAAFVWAVAFCSAGYLFGNVVERFGRRKSEMVTWGVRELTLSALGLFILIIVARLLFLRWQETRAKSRKDP